MKCLISMFLFFNSLTAVAETLNFAVMIDHSKETLFTAACGAVDEYFETDIAFGNFIEKDLKRTKYGYNNLATRTVLNEKNYNIFVTSFTSQIDPYVEYIMYAMTSQDEIHNQKQWCNILNITFFESILKKKYRYYDRVLYQK